jgi:hypothetical protein
MTTIDLSNEQLATVVATSILNSLTPEKRTELITNAITALLTERDGYSKQNRLQQLFNSAVESVARQLVEGELAGSIEFIANVTTVIREASERVFAGDRREALVEKMAGAIRASLTERSY